MLGYYSSQAQIFLWVLGIVTTLAFALPLFIAPLAWARLMLFSVPEDKNLNIYFGRCLGAFILVIEWMIFRGAIDTAMTPITFQILFAVFGIMLLVHLYGWFRGIQPVTENLENIMWAGLFLLAVLFYPVSA
jgi:hypothetical protein